MPRGAEEQKRSVPFQLLLLLEKMQDSRQKAVLPTELVQCLQKYNVPCKSPLSSGLPTDAVLGGVAALGKDRGSRLMGSERTSEVLVLIRNSSLLLKIRSLTHDFNFFYYDFYQLTALKWL